LVSLPLTAPVPVVFDHFVGAQGALGLEQPGFADFVELIRAGKAYVKISGAYRASKLAPDYQDAAPLAKALIAANVDQIIWGTDWPHPNSSSGNKATAHESARRLGARSGNAQEDPSR
jgi:predicted TIM-barrel fold metal-dependent hydrolase